MAKTTSEDLLQASSSYDHQTNKPKLEHSNIAPSTGSHCGDAIPSPIKQTSDAGNGRIQISMDTLQSQHVNSRNDYFTAAQRELEK